MEVTVKEQFNSVGSHSSMRRMIFKRRMVETATRTYLLELRVDLGKTVRVVGLNRI